MRLFFALWPDPATRETLARWSVALHQACGGRRVPAENLHMTLAFVGSLPDARLPEALAAGASIEARAFELVLDRPIYRKRNEMAWAGTTTMPPALGAMAADLRAALAAVQVPFDAKPFAAHVTLVREARSPAAMPELSPIVWPVEGFALVRSVTVPRGSQYELLKSWTGSS